MKNYRKTSDGKKGGLFVGKSHDKGGIPAIVVDTGQPIEVEGGEAIINKEATKKYWKELSKINQSAGNGNPIPPPQGFSDEVSQYSNGGKISKLAITEGTKHELEHRDTIAKFKKQGISDKEVARKIALDHLKENPNYYKVLKKLKLKKGGEIVCRSCGWSWLESENPIGENLYKCHKCNSDNKNFYKTGGAVENKKEVYDEWKTLVNMSASELKEFLKTEDGKKAGLTKEKADELGIGSGRESASWILKMKAVPYSQWSDTMWSWAKRQIGFIKRMSGNQGGLYEDNGKKTRKHTSLLIWGHNPEKFKGGGLVDKINDLRFYETPIDADYIDSKSKKGHTLDNLPKNTQKIYINSNLFEKEKYAWGKVSNNKIAYHERPIDDKYWNKNIYKEPLVLIEYDDENNQLRVRDGNHRLNVYLNEKYKYIPIVLTKKALKFISKLANGTNTTFDDNTDIRFKGGGRTIAQTPAPKKDRIVGSENNAPKSSESSKSAEKIVLSEQVLESIENILREYNKDTSKKVDLNTAKAVVRRGMGAYSSSHRPTISGGKPNSRVAWGLARLKAFLYKIENGESKSGRYSQDNDLLDDLGYEHEKFAKGNKIKAENKGGNCYEMAGKLAMGIMFADKDMSYPDFKGTPYVVHAEVSGQGAISGLRYGHAWVEDDMFIYDFSNGRKIVFPKELYYAIGNVITKPPKYYKYTFDEARKKMSETGHYGSWELKTESGL